MEQDSGIGPLFANPASQHQSKNHSKELWRKKTEQY